MKIITAIIKPLMLDAVTDALIALGVGGMTVLEVKGFGQQRGHVGSYHQTTTTSSRRHEDPPVQLLSKLRLDVAVKDSMVEKVIEAIVSTAHTGRVGDGKVFVTDLPRAIRIRNRETGDEAL